MKIDILDIDKLLSINKLKEVESASLFYNKNNFHPEGIMSNEIFGISSHDRRFTYGYVNLDMHFIHPYIFKAVLKPVFRGVINIINGKDKYSITNGVLTKDENGWTGIESLYKHWEEIDWTKLGSANTDAITILSRKPKDIIFINKFIISPPFYRDIKLGTNMDPSEYTNSLNLLYQRLIRTISTLKVAGPLFNFHQYQTQYTIQLILVEIYDYFIQRIKGKAGLIKKNLLGKSIDYGVRAVISAPEYHHNNFEDNMIDMEHCALPLSQAVSLFKPFVVAYLKNFFTQELINRADSYTARDADKLIFVKINSPEIQFSDKFIEKMIDNYVFNPDGRFEVIKVEFENPKDSSKTLIAPLYIKGRKILTQDQQEELYRPMTVTDLLYIAASDACNNRHVMISRYPVGTDKGIFFNKIRIQSTLKHDHVVYNGKEYNFFPHIETVSGDVSVKTLFKDSLSFQNSYLDGLGKHPSRCRV